MRYNITYLFLVTATTLLSQQVVISRIEQMPSLPQPFEMRDWNRVARLYDSLVYDLSLTGDHLPLTTINTETVNYPEHDSYAMQSYVGSFSPTSVEAINMLPSVIGATLNGIDKSDQFGRNWVAMCEEFFNRASGEHVYLNNAQGQSGHDWWYETMPNIFFYQLHALYPGTGNFDEQFGTVAARWYEAVKEMGGDNAPWQVPYMNYRAWNLLRMEPLDEGVREPEAAGALAWIFYAAYSETGNREYRVAAEWCMEFLNSLESNPSYELQLAYGAVTAAKMNAVLGTNYDLEKMINWCFDIGPLRNWGAITGNWGGLDCYGLIGEQAPGGTGYAFAMNGFQQAAALAPLVRYNDRYADAIGKWILNVANASRLFYSAFLPEENQDAHSWTSNNDPNSVIAYEAIKETLNSKTPFATGDAVGGGWAATNLALYGSSHVGMLGGILKRTNIEEILQIDLLKTDFYRDTAFPTYLFFNPHATQQQVEFDPGDTTYDLYESISNQFIATGQSGPSSFPVPAQSALVIVLVPQGAEITHMGQTTLANGVVIDYHNGTVTENYPPRIKSLAGADTLVLTGSTQLIYCTAEDRDGDTLQYKWSLGDDAWNSDSTYKWTVPEIPGYYIISCTVKDPGDLTDSLNFILHVVERIVEPPVITGISAENRKIHPGNAVSVWCDATDINNDTLQYNWSADAGTFQGVGSEVTWTTPATAGIYTIRCKVINQDMLTDTDSLEMLVKDSTWSQQGDLIAGFYLNGNSRDFSAYQNHGVPSNITWTTNPEGVAGKAASFNGSSSRIDVPNKDHLNSREGLSVLCRIKPGQQISSEQFIVSHGSWQNRWKISLINNNHVRFTVNGTSGITDLDSEIMLDEGTWYHLAATYDGIHLELYINGELDSFKPWSGTINTTTYNLLIGQMLPDNAMYNFNGSIDDVRIYNYGIDNQVIESDFGGELAIRETELPENPLLISPNPAHTNAEITIKFQGIIPQKIWVSDAAGNSVWTSANQEDRFVNGSLKLSIDHFKSGFYLVSMMADGKIYTRKLVIL